MAPDTASGTEWTHLSNEIYAGLIQPGTEFWQQALDLIQREGEGEAEWTRDIQTVVVGIRYGQTLLAVCPLHKILIVGNLVVSPVHRNMGFASLMASCVDKLQAPGTTLYALISHEATRHLAQKHGMSLSAGELWQREK